MTRRLIVHVAGSPVPYRRVSDSKKAKRGKRVPARQRMFRDLVAGAAWAAMRNAGLRQPLRGAVRLSFTFRCRALNQLGDTTNLIKLFEDACNGIVWLDDTQVVGFGEVNRLLDRKNPGLWATVETLGPEWDEHLPKKYRCTT